MSTTRETILGIIADVAPDADTTKLDDQADLRDELDIDSMDLLNVLIGIDGKLHVSAPERDYGEVQTLGALVANVDARRA